MSDEIELVTQEVTGKGPLRCACGVLVLVTDNNGSIGQGLECECGWEGILLEPVGVVVMGDQIEWVG